MMDIDTLRLNEQGLIPAIVQDADSGKVLMMAYMNRESLKKTMETGLACFYSRSRKCLWTKGETSGNVQRVVSVQADCDLDTLLITVRKAGPACHLGTETCFADPFFVGEEPAGFTPDSLMKLLEDRKKDRPVGSYTSYLFEKGRDKILKKIGEEATEVIIAGKAGDGPDTVYEIADLCYHVMVLMAEMGISLTDIRAELASRHVIDRKVKQEKMT